MPLYQRALTIHEKAFGPEHPIVGRNLINLAGTYQVQNQYAQAEVLYQRAARIFKKSLGPDNVELANAVKSFGAALRIAGVIFAGRTALSAGADDP